jgi:hypothetical protein
MNYSTEESASNDPAEIVIEFANKVVEDQKQ